jgi:putative copper export protein
MENNVLIFIHLMSAAIAVGSLAYCLLFFLPVMEKLPEEKQPEEHRVAYKALEILAPTVMASVLMLIGTGIYYLLTNYTRQVDLAPGYYNLFGVKMVFVVIALFLSVYHTFTLRARIADLDLSPENRERVPATLQKMKSFGQMILTTLTVAFFLGIWLARF